MFEIVIGFISGIVSGTGMGGGTILIVLLTFILGIEQHVAQATNLIFFIPTSIIAIIVNLKNKNIALKTATIITPWRRISRAPATAKAPRRSAWLWQSVPRKRASKRLFLTAAAMCITAVSLLWLRAPAKAA